MMPLIVVWLEAWHLMFIMTSRFLWLNIARPVCTDLPPRPQVNPRLLRYENVTLLPHIGGLSRDSMVVSCVVYRNRGES